MTLQRINSMKKERILVWLLATSPLLLSLQSPYTWQETKVQEDYKEAVDSINKDDLLNHLKKLCTDFKGRKSGSDGEKMTAEYMGEEFKKYGLLPAGEEASYLQTFKSKGGSPGHNAIGYLEGSDEKLKKECIAIGGHIDAVGGFGADDNGSGAVGVLELAQAFSTLKQKPKRSILFLGFGSEEQWMYGSYHYVKNTTKFSLKDTKFYINMDMIGRNDKDEKRVCIAGSDSCKPSVENIVVKYAKKAGLTVFIEEPKTHPPGDNLPFYDNKIPFLYFYSWLFGDFHSDYHKPGDKHEKVDYESEEKIVRLVFKIAIDIANLDQMPEFSPINKWSHPGQKKSSKRKPVEPEK